MQLQHDGRAFFCRDQLSRFFRKCRIKAALAYFGTQAAISAAETGVEAGANYWMQGNLDNFSTLGTFGKNFGINVVTGGIGSKGKWVYKAAAYAGRQTLEISGDTAYDVYANNRSFGNALLTNSIGSIVGEAGGRAIGIGLRGAGRGLKSLDYGEFQSIVSASPLGRMIAPNGRMPGVFAVVGDGARRSDSAKRVTGQKPAAAPVGTRRQQIPSIEGNPPTTISGRSYSGHAIDRMQGRGVPPSAVENSIRPGNRIGPGNTPGTSVYRDSVNGVKAVVDDATGRVITVM